MNQVDASGISKAFQTALLGHDEAVVETLVSYNAKAERVSLRKLVDSLLKRTGKPRGEGGHARAYLWGGAFGWGAVTGERLRRACFGVFSSSQSMLLKSRTNPAALMLRTDSGMIALLELLPPFVREWYALYISRGRRRWSAEEVAELTASANAAGAPPRSTPRDAAGAGGPSTTPWRDSQSLGTPVGETSYPQPEDIKTNWTDLLLWAVLADEREIARHLWVKTSEPMRFAIWAAHIAHVTASAQLNVTKKAQWEEAADIYEAWARSVLDEEKDAEAAARQLTYTSECYDGSVLDHAIVAETSARRCRSFVSHEHTMDVAERYFFGDFPGSPAFIESHSASWARILLHVLCLAQAR